MKQLHVYFSGQVQGVGLRYATKDMADSLGITGWIENLDDGRVELFAEADEDILKKFLRNLNQSFNIKETQTSWSPATQQYPTFTIR